MDNSLFQVDETLDASNDANSAAEDSIENSDETGVPIVVPFDPNLIRIRRDPYTMGELIDRIQHQEVNFYTGFQRKQGLWTDVQQSRLIESLLLKLPLPAFYFDESAGNIWEVIDGLQRTSAIEKFIVQKSLTLVGLEFLTAYNGSKYDDLPRDLIRRISTTPITVYVVEKGTPNEVKFNIFKRINTGGLVLSNQEIRHALNQGVAADFVRDLAEIQDFKNATKNLIKSERMEDRDFVTRFVAFYITNYKEYKPDLDTFMSKAMGLLGKLSSEDLTAMRTDFVQAMRTAIGVFGQDAFRKRRNISDKRRPINKALFETISVGFSRLTERETHHLISNRDGLITRFIELNNDNRFFSSLASGTGQPENVFNRFSNIERIIRETLEN